METKHSILNGHCEKKRNIRASGSSSMSGKHIEQHMNLWYTQKRTNSQNSCASLVSFDTRTTNDGKVEQIVILKKGKNDTSQSGAVLTFEEDHVLRMVCEEDDEKNESTVLEIKCKDLLQLCVDPSIVFSCKEEEDFARYAGISEFLSEHQNMLFVNDDYCDGKQLAIRIAYARSYK